VLDVIVFRSPKAEWAVLIRIGVMLTEVVSIKGI